MRAILMRAIPRMVARLLVTALPWIAIASLPMQIPAHLTAIPHTRMDTRAEPVVDTLRAKRKDFNR